MTALFGTAVACAAVAIISVFMWDEPFAIYLLIGGALYLVGTILLTMTYHVPRNNALAAIDSDSAEATSFWTRYVAEWTAWNHVRGAAALAAAALFTTALTVG